MDFLNGKTVQNINKWNVENYKKLYHFNKFFGFENLSKIPILLLFFKPVNVKQAIVAYFYKTTNQTISKI